MDGVEVEAAATQRLHGHHPAEGDHRHLRRAAADVDDHVADGLVDRQSGPDGGRHGLLNEEAGRRAGPARRLLDGAALDRRDGGRDADQHLGPVEAADADTAQQHAEHPLGDLEVGDGAAAQRPLGHDVPRRPADHLPGVGADGQHLAAARIERHHGRLVQHQALPLGVDKRVGRPEIDGQVA